MHSVKNQMVNFYLNIVVTGTYRNKFKAHTSEEIRELVGRKFLDYDRIVTEQTGPLRILMKKRSGNYIMKKSINPTKISEGLFSTFESSRFDYYNSPLSKVKF